MENALASASGMDDIDDDIELEELINATISQNNNEVYYDFEDEEEEPDGIDVNDVVDETFGDGIGLENESEIGIDFENYENFDIILPENEASSMNINIQEPLEISKPESPLSMHKGNI